MRLCVRILLLWLVIAPGLATAGESVSVEAGMIEVTSEQMEADQQTNKVTFTGKVVGRRGSMTIYADQLMLFFIDIDGRRQIEHLEAAGDVRVVEGERIVTAQRLKYYQTEEKMVLQENAMIHQGGNQIAGDEIILFMRENRSLVKSGENGRVKAVFLPSQARP